MVQSKSALELGLGQPAQKPLDRCVGQWCGAISTKQRISVPLPADELERMTVSGAKASARFVALHKDG